MIRLFVETPFVLQLALRQEQAGVCAQLLDLAESGALELVVPLLALVEPLGTFRLRTNKHRERNNRWREEARDLARTDEPRYRSAAQALKEARLHMAEMDDEERRRLDAVIARTWKSARIALPSASTFQIAYELERKGQSGKGQTSIDALAIATILEDARAAPIEAKMAFYALDRRAVNTFIVTDLSAANVKLFSHPQPLASWLKSERVDLAVAADAPAAQEPDAIEPPTPEA